jgi:hypothetical protein
MWVVLSGVDCQTMPQAFEQWLPDALEDRLGEFDRAKGLEMEKMNKPPVE